MATKGIGRPLTILLRADTDGFAKGIQTAETKLKGLNKSLTNSSVVATAALGGLAAAGFEFAKAAAEDERSSRVLAKTLGNVTNATEAQTRAVEDYITQTSLAFGIQDDELRPALGRLVRSTEDAAEAQKLLNLALDISAATGKPIEKIADSLGKAYDGNRTALGRLGLGLDATTLKSKDFSEIYKVLSTQFEGFAKSEAATGEGSLRRLSVAVDEAKESIGRGLLPFVVRAADELTRLAPTIERNAGNIIKFGGAAGIAAASIVALKIAVSAASIAVQVATVTASGLRLAYLTLAAATGSATAKQVLAELSYKNVTIASRLYSIALGINTAALKVAEVGVMNFTRALLLNPYTAVIVGLGTAAVYLYKWQQATLTAQAANDKLNGGLETTAKRYNYLNEASRAAAGGVLGFAAASSSASQESRDAARANGRSTSTYVSLRAQLEKIDKLYPSVETGTTGLSKAAQAAADKLKAQKEALAATKKAFADYASGVKSALSAQFSFQDAFETKGTSSFLEALRKQAAAAIAFSGKIAKLVSSGLSRGGIDQVLAAGPLVGGQIADELLKGGAGAIGEVNSLVSSVNAITGQTGTAVSAGLGGTTGNGNINITINGAIDPEGVRRSLEKLFQDSARRTSAMNFVGATL
jgi:hypothetical protein